MRKTTILLCAALLCHIVSFAQCISSPTFPVSFGTEPLVAPGDHINISQTKYYYGAAVAMSNVKMNGGTLVVTGDLTLNDLVFDSGTVFIHPGATLVINNAAGLILRGNARIYNAGTFQCLGNFVMDGTWATAAKPNLFLNVFSNSYFKMPNQYFVINNAHSWLVNNGIGDFHGIITDPPSAKGSVCLGFNSQTRMRVIYNRAKHPYMAPNGPACVYVDLYSQLYDTLTNYPTINMCLGASHNSDASCIPWGCRPNAWGDAQVTTGCASCASVLTFLSVQFKNVEAVAITAANELRWEIERTPPGKFYIERSPDGNQFTRIDSVVATGATSYRYKDLEKPSSAYYRIVYGNAAQQLASKVVKITAEEKLQHPYPNPFKNALVLPIKTMQRDMQLRLTDAAGRRINQYKIIYGTDEVKIAFGELPAGLYLLTVNNNGRYTTFKIVRE